MSHFTVLIIGEDPEGQLEQYDENLEVPEYEVGEVPQSDIDSFMESNSEGSDDFAETYAKHGKDWNNGNWRYNKEGKWIEYSTYNPDSKWDWYSLGGRWDGYFTLKNGVKTNSALKKDIDFEKTKDDAFTEALAYYKKNKDREKIQCSDQEFATKWANTACVPYSILNNGEWIEKGDMGWWGISSNEKEDWDLIANSIIKDVDDNELFSLYDCHI